MKIEGHGPNPLNSTNDAQATAGNERVQGGRSDPGQRGDHVRSDRVEVSDDARLMEDAVRQVQRVPEIRQDVVERARQKLAAGEVGRDPFKLADKIIDSLLSH
jgi:flagellar biosynthesis anti-sigma factor FlgM